MFFTKKVCVSVDNVAVFDRRTCLEQVGHIPAKHVRQEPSTLRSLLSLILCVLHAVTLCMRVFIACHCHYNHADLCMLSARLDPACRYRQPPINGYCTLPRRPAAWRRVSSGNSQQWLSLKTKGSSVHTCTSLCVLCFCFFHISF